MSGAIRSAAFFKVRDGRTLVPLWLEPEGSTFVVFREAAAGGDNLIYATRNAEVIVPAREWVQGGAVPIQVTVGRGDEVTARLSQPGRYEFGFAKGGTQVIDVPQISSPVEIGGPWEVQLQPGRGAPEKIVLERLMDLSEHASEGVRYFSGTATYLTTFTVPPRLIGEAQGLSLDLGNVQVMARVQLNGQDLGVLWKVPYRLDITSAARPGENALEVTVANLWLNRLIGDRSLPPERRVAWTTWNPFTDDSPLPQSGLLGPVTLQVEEIRRVR
ncbi:MAG: glycosylhydrolase-like jelly roll fold domain-containing protein [Planctomycetota bacterium]